MLTERPATQIGILSDEALRYEEPIEISTDDWSSFSEILSISEITFQQNNVTHTDNFEN